MSAAIQIPQMDDEDLRRYIASAAPPPETPVIPMAAQPMPSIPTAAPERPKLVNPQGKAISTGRVGGIPGKINPEGAPDAGLYNPDNGPAIASLWAKADNIHNPVLRVLGKIGAGAARAIDTAGNVVAPGVMANVPGTSLNKAIEVQGQRRQQAQDVKQGLETAQTHEAEAGAKLRTAQAGAATNPKPEKPENIQQVYADAVQDALERGFDPNKDAKVLQLRDSITSLQKETAPKEPNRDDRAIAIMSKPKEQWSPEEAAYMKGYDAYIQKTKVAPQVSLIGTREAAAEKKEDRTVKRQDVRAHDKAYVQPAEAVEKSYQMMNNAYNDYKAAKAQGKELPTGAESMLALSTHLTTTFGNVKGARITKDMIEHHLGARSISDSALVAVQKLTNGDTLSPDQWEAFHKLIGESRKLSWQTAVKEADRKQIPVDFLPEDLKGLTGEGVQEPTRPAHVPEGYIFKPNGPKGAGWYKP